MPNIANVLKEEISRLARKEVKTQTASLRKASVEYRRQIAALKRRVQDLEGRSSTGKKQRPAVTEADAADNAEGGSSRVRYSAKAFRANRERLGLSVSEYGKLLGVSDQSIYNWEQGKARPSRRHIDAYVAVRSMGKRAARSRLDQA